MNRAQYIEALTWCFKMEAAGAIAGEVGMLLRQDPDEKRKLDAFRRMESSNKLSCLAALRKEEVSRPAVEPAFYRAAYKLGLRFGEGTWSDFLDRFEATIHPNEFARYVTADGELIPHEYAGVNAPLFDQLLAHEQALARFVRLERDGRGEEALGEIMAILHRGPPETLIGSEDPVGW